MHNILNIVNLFYKLAAKYRIHSLPTGWLVEGFWWSPDFISGIRNISNIAQDPKFAQMAWHMIQDGVKPFSIEDWLSQHETPIKEAIDLGNKTWEIDGAKLKEEDVSPNTDFRRFLESRGIDIKQQPHEPPPKENTWKEDMWNSIWDSLFIYSDLKKKGKLLTGIKQSIIKDIRAEFGLNSYEASEYLEEFLKKENLTL